MHRHRKNYKSNKLSEEPETLLKNAGFAFYGGSGPVARVSDDKDHTDTDASNNTSERECRESRVANKRDFVEEVKSNSRGGKGSTRRALGKGRREQPKNQIHGQKGNIKVLRKRVRKLEHELERKWERRFRQLCSLAEHVEELRGELHERINSLEMENIVEKMHGQKNVAVEKEGSWRLPGAAIASAPNTTPEFKECFC